MAEIRRVGVVGAGTMGNGIAHVFARSGFPVVLAEVDQPALDRGLSTIDKNLAREVAKGKLAQADSDAARARIAGTLDRRMLAGCDLVVEAATERFAVKQSLFQELDGLLGATPFSLQIPRRSPLPSWRLRRSARTALSACTSSTPCR